MTTAHYAFRYDQDKDGYISVYLDGEFYLGTWNFERVEQCITLHVEHHGGIWSLINNAS